MWHEAYLPARRCCAEVRKLTPMLLRIHDAKASRAHSRLDGIVYVFEQELLIWGTLYSVTASKMSPKSEGRCVAGGSPN